MRRKQRAQRGMGLSGEALQAHLPQADELLDAECAGVYRGWAEGQILAEIGAAAGITAEGVRQRLKRIATAFLGVGGKHQPGLQRASARDGPLTASKRNCYVRPLRARLRLRAVMTTCLGRRRAIPDSGRESLATL